MEKQLKMSIEIIITYNSEVAPTMKDWYCI